MDEIERVFSHPVALAQCRRFLAAHPKMKAIAFYDTAGSVKHLVEERDSTRRPSPARRRRGFMAHEILEAGIEDNAENYTRFFLVRRSGEAEFDPKANKMSMAFSLENRPGSLVAALSALERHRHESDQDRIAAGSRQAMGVHLLRGLPAWGERGGSAALEALQAHCGMVKELGRYREARGSVRFGTWMSWIARI